MRGLRVTPAMATTLAGVLMAWGTGPAEETQVTSQAPATSSSSTTTTTKPAATAAPASSPLEATCDRDEALAAVLASDAAGAGGHIDYLECLDGFGGRSTAWAKRHTSSCPSPPTATRCWTSRHRSARLTQECQPMSLGRSHHHRRPPTTARRRPRPAQVSRRATRRRMTRAISPGVRRAWRTRPHTQDASHDDVLPGRHWPSPEHPTTDLAPRRWWR